MFPEIIIGGSKGDSKYWCKSYIENEKVVEGKQRIREIRDCYLCENVECVIKKELDAIKSEYYKHMFCALCPRKIEFMYFVILYKLKKSGILLDNFAPLCCFCFEKYNFFRSKDSL